MTQTIETRPDPKTQSNSTAVGVFATTSTMSTTTMATSVNAPT